MLGNERGQETLGRRLVYCSVLTALAYAGNVLALQMFFGVSFVFGSIFWMLAIVLCGPALGMLSAAIASVQIYFLWHAASNVVIFLAEAAFVAYVYSRRGGSLLLLDAIFWIAIGIPMGLSIFLINFDINHEAIYVIILKQAINGIFNALVATVMLSGLRRMPWGLAPRRRGRSLHETLFVAMAAMVLIPSIIGMTATSRESYRNLENRIVADTLYASTHLNALLAAWLEDHGASVRSLATYSDDPSGGSQMRNQTLLAAIIKSSPGFQRMGILNAGYKSVAFWPSIYNGHPNIGRDFSDREYLTKLHTPDELGISGILSARAGPPEQIVVIASPIVRGGHLRGIALGTILARELASTMRSALGRKDMSATLVDATGKVVASTDDEVRPMAAFRGIDTYDTTNISDGVSLLNPMEQRDSPIAEKWAASLYATSAPLPVAGGWRLVVEAPVMPY